MLRQSAIFRGGRTLEAAEAICADERFPDWDAIALLASLVDKSLVVADTGGEDRRYRLLESTRQFVAERLTEAGEAEAVAARHCRYFAKLAQSASDAYWRTDSAVWTAQVRVELENTAPRSAGGLWTVPIQKRRRRSSLVWARCGPRSRAEKDARCSNGRPPPCRATHPRAFAES